MVAKGFRKDHKDSVLSLCSLRYLRALCSQIRLLGHPPLHFDHFSTHLPAGGSLTG